MRSTYSWFFVSVAFLPLLVGAAGSITITAPSEDGAFAVMYNPATGSTYAQGVFSSGVAKINASSVPIGSQFAVKVTAAADRLWSSDVYWRSANGNRYLQRTWNGTDWSSEVLTGEITSRTYNTSGATRSMSFTLQGASDLSVYDNNANALDAKVSVYRPTTLGDDFFNPDMTRQWIPTTLATGYHYTVADSVDYFKAIHVYNDASTFSADYLGVADGANYQILFNIFEGLNSAGGTVYDVGGAITFNGDGTAVTFTANMLSTATLLDRVPYYLVADDVSIFDAGSNYSKVNDSGMSLVHPDYYAVPEPATALMLAVSSAVLLFVRRRFFD